MRVFKIVRFFRRVGLREGIRRLALHAWSLVDYHFDLVLLVKHPLSVEPERAAVGYELRGMGPDEMDRLDGALYLDRLEMLRRFARGDACAVVIADGCIAASAWGAFAIADIPEIFLETPLPPRTGYVFTVECDQAFRRRGFGSAVVREIERIAERAGVETMTVAVSPDNAPSMNLFVGRGYRPFREVRVRRILGIKSVQSIELDTGFSSLLRAPGDGFESRGSHDGR